MTRDSVIATLRSHETEPKQLGVEHLYLFGSTVRDAAHFGSDMA